MFVLSTCNRTEIYAHMANIPQAFDKIQNILFAVKKVEVQTHLLKYFYHFVDAGAVKHLFNVIAGLDSLVIGEKQILGQVKKAIELARSRGAFKRDFNSTIPRPSGRGFPPEGRARETMGFSNSGFYIDTPPFKAGRFINEFGY